MAGETEAVTTTETAQQLPESATVDEAVALMGGIEEGGDERETADTSNAQEEGGDTVETEESEQEVSTQEAERTDDDPAPEFWSAEDKEFWKTVPPELRPVLKKYEQQRIEFANQKAREAAQERARAVEDAQKATSLVDQAAQWWRQNGPALKQAFADKWASVDWNKLADENPAEWARLKQQRDNEATLLVEANRRGQADIEAANQRAEATLQGSKRAEHTKLAAKLPEYFGPEKAAKTYDELGNFLFAKGIPANIINQTYEAPIIEIALNAMRFERAQEKASAVTNQTANTPAKQTPTRVQPGPAALTAGNRNAEQARQVGERFRKSGGASIADAAELIRLSGL